MTEKFVRNDQTLAADVGDDVVAMSVARGECYGMTDVTAAVWRMLEEPSDLASICARLQTDYDVDEQTCRDDVARLLGEMEAKELVRRVRRH